MQKYLVVIEKGENNYSAFSPDVLGCIVTGKTIEKTIKNMKDAIEFHLEGEEEIPKAIPLKKHIEAGTFDDNAIGEEYIITKIEVRIPQMA